MSVVRTLLLLDPLRGPVVSRHDAVPPMMPPPPGRAPTPLAPGDPAILAKHRERIIAMANDEVQWIQVEGFQPPEAHLLDFDIVLLATVDCWLHAIIATPSAAQTWIDVRWTLCPALMTHPARDALCNRFGKPSKPGPKWPNYKWGHDVVLDRLRKWHAAGYLQLETDYRQQPPLHLVAPRQRGVIRAVWLAQRLGLPLPPLLPEAGDRLVAAASAAGPAPPR